jgi:hypothetical protein
MSDLNNDPRYKIIFDNPSTTLPPNNNNTNLQFVIETPNHYSSSTPPPPNDNNNPNNPTREPQADADAKAKKKAQYEAKKKKNLERYHENKKNNNTTTRKYIRRNIKTKVTKKQNKQEYYKEYGNQYNTQLKKEKEERENEKKETVVEKEDIPVTPENLTHKHKLNFIVNDEIPLAPCIEDFEKWKKAQNRPTEYTSDKQKKIALKIHNALTRSDADNLLIRNLQSQLETAEKQNNQHAIDAIKKEIGDITGKNSDNNILKKQYELIEMYEKMTLNNSTIKSENDIAFEKFRNTKFSKEKNLNDIEEKLILQREDLLYKINEIKKIRNNLYTTSMMELIKEEVKKEIEIDAEEIIKIENYKDPHTLSKTESDRLVNKYKLEELKNSSGPFGETVRITIPKEFCNPPPNFYNTSSQSSASNQTLEFTKERINNAREKKKNLTINNS